jgi:hypothetical protein
MRLGIYDVCLDEQFALHYSWSTEERARRALHNVSSLLQPGGYFIGTMPDANVIVHKLRDAEGLQFGNSVYEIRFDDHFRDKVDHKALSEPYKLLFLCITFIWGRWWFSYLLSQESACGIAALSLITAIWDSV